MRRQSVEFDIIEISNDELKQLSTIQMQLLRTAQKKKNELKYKMEQDLALFKKLVYTDGMKESELLQQKREELEGQFNYEVEILAEQLGYAMKLNEPYPDWDDENASAGYIVDYTLNYTDRYIIVRDYYLAISPPSERMALYAADEAAKRYLGTYYDTLYDVLSTYSR